MCRKSLTRTPALSSGRIYKQVSVLATRSLLWELPGLVSNNKLALKTLRLVKQVSRFSRTHPLSLSQGQGSTSSRETSTPRARPKSHTERSQFAFTKRLDGWKMIVMVVVMMMMMVPRETITTTTTTTVAVAEESQGVR